MITITNVTQPDPVNNPQLLQVTCSTAGTAVPPAPAAPAAPITVTCWAELDGADVTSHVPAAPQGGGTWIATLNLLELGPNYFPDTTYTIFAAYIADTTSTDYTTES